jgi:hypothetical protein
MRKTERCWKYRSGGCLKKISVSDFPQLLLYTLAFCRLLSLSLAVRSFSADTEIFSGRLGQRIPDFDYQDTRIQNAVMP